MFNFQKYDFPKLGLVRLPEIKLTKEELSLTNSDNLSNFEFLKAITSKGLNEKLKDIPISEHKKYEEKLEFELNLIEELSFTDYFLLVWRVINKARKSGAYIDHGRGSMVSSLIFFALQITGINPIEKKLYLSRFISKVRAKKQIIDGVTFIDGSLAPDADLNLSIWREEICEWLKELYPGKISKITALGTLTGKILIKDVYKVLGNATEEQAKYVSDLVEKHHGIVEDIELMPKKNSEFKKWSESNELIYSTCLKLRDLYRQKSCHPSGYLVSFYNLHDIVPLELNKEKELTCGFVMDDAAKVAIKLDLLGLTTNKIIKEVLDQIPEKIEEIDKKLDNDPFIYDVLQGDFLPYGLYQISANTAFKVTKKIKPKNIHELSDVNAIARPSSLLFLNDYVENKSEAPHAIFKKDLANTRNFCLYQENLLDMAISIGFSPDEAEQIRRTVAKKKVDEVKLWKVKVEDKCREKKLDKEVAEIYWKLLEINALYSFNRSHSYGVSALGALTIYLKYKYPVQFYTACLNNAKELPNPIDEIKMIRKELIHFGIKLLAPDITQSDFNKFTINGNNILFPVSNIKGVSEKNLEKLKKFKVKDGNKFDIFKAAKEAKLPINVLAGLTLSGSLDQFLTQTRTRTVMEACLWNLLTTKEHNYCLQYGEQYQYNLTELVRALNEKIFDDKGKPVIKDSRRDTLRKHFHPYNEIYKNNSKNDKLTSFFYEKVYLGFSYSTTLYELFKPVCADLATITEFNGGLNDEYYKLIGEVVEVKQDVSKNGNRYLRVKIENDDGEVMLFLFDGKYGRIQDHEETNGEIVTPGSIVIANGRKKENSLFADYISKQEYLIIDKISQVEKLAKTA
jgi:DNA polymerase III subunit alpha